MCPPEDIHVVGTSVPGISRLACDNGFKLSLPWVCQRTPLFAIRAQETPWPVSQQWHGISKHALFIGRPADSTHRHGLDYHPDMTTIATRCRFAQCSFSARGWVGQRRSVYRRHNGLPAQFVCSVTACDNECASCIWDILFEAVLDMPS